MKYVLAGCLAVIFHQLNAQDDGENKLIQNVEETTEQSRHAMHAEIGGRTFIFASLNYEYALSEHVLIGGGLGMINLMAGEIIRNNTGTAETGDYLDTGTTQMIYGSYFIGKNKHKIFFTAGLTNFLFTYRNTYPLETEISREAQLEWNAGIGYQFSVKRTYFRLTGYCISMPEPSGWFPAYMPWLGLSLGFKIS